MKCTNISCEISVAYTYYAKPWLMRTGDEIRINTILSSLAESESKMFVVTLSGCNGKQIKRVLKGNTLYNLTQRKSYGLTRRGYSDTMDALWKLTLFFDEAIASIYLSRYLKSLRARKILIFGSMSIMPLLLDTMKKTKVIDPCLKIIYDPLANYAQTLFYRSRSSLLELGKYALFLAIHKLSVRSADVVLYPSQLDKENAEKMFEPKLSVVVQNHPSICYNSIEEYSEHRKRLRTENTPTFLLLAGGRGGYNYEAVSLTIKLFNKLPPDRFKLYITGPWLDLKDSVKNPSIRLLGVLSNEELKSIIAASDYGLSPIFSHVSGTFLKVLTYIAGGLNLITSVHALVGLSHDLLRRARKVIIVKNKEEYRNVIEKIVLEGETFTEGRRTHEQSILTCDQLKKNIERDITRLSRVQVGP